MYFSQNLLFGVIRGIIGVIGDNNNCNKWKNFLIQNNMNDVAYYLLKYFIIIYNIFHHITLHKKVMADKAEFCYI